MNKNFVLWLKSVRNFFWVPLRGLLRCIMSFGWKGWWKAAILILVVLFLVGRAVEYIGIVADAASNVRSRQDNKELVDKVDRLERDLREKSSSVTKPADDDIDAITAVPPASTLNHSGSGHGGPGVRINIPGMGNKFCRVGDPTRDFNYKKDLGGLFVNESTGEVCITKPEVWVADRRAGREFSPFERFSQAYPEAAREVWRMTGPPRAKRVLH